MVSDKVPEDYQLEYKSKLDLNNRDHKRNLLKTISAFSNTSGGLLVYGITEAENGIPDELKGIIWDNCDANIRALTSIIRDRSEPTITIFEPHYFQLENSDKIALVIKVPKSWRGPHRVKMNGKEEFFIRIKNKSDPMSIEDLRTSFNLSETLTHKIRRFRENRISELYINKTPVPFEGNSKLLIQLIPLNAFYPEININLPLITDHLNELAPINPGHGYNHGYNIDGYIVFTGNYRDRLSYSYLQLYRNGIIEIVEDCDPESIIDRVISDERGIIDFISKNLTILKNIGVEAPITILISLINVKKVQRFSSHTIFRFRPPTIYNDIINLPEVLLESYDVSIANSLKIAFDVAWNAAGHLKSPNYNNNGERI